MLSTSPVPTSEILAIRPTRPSPLGNIEVPCPQSFCANLLEWYAKIVDVVQAGLRSIAAKDESELIAKYDEHFQGQVSPANFRLYRKLRMRVADASGRRVKKFFLALNLT